MRITVNIVCQAVIRVKKSKSGLGVGRAWWVGRCRLGASLESVSQKASVRR